jgi:hypothetical protein
MGIAVDGCFVDRGYGGIFAHRQTLALILAVSADRTSRSIGLLGPGRARLRRGAGPGGAKKRARTQRIAANRARSTILWRTASGMPWSAILGT